MKKPVSKKPARTRRVGEDDIRPEYDFSKARPNPYASRFQAGVTVVTLDADVAKTFPDAATVNDALRALAKIANHPVTKSRSKHRTA
ncbi:MAG: hypothetical protein ACREOJ_09925 [Gemmatimonadaceae bacterium]